MDGQSWKSKRSFKKNIDFHPFEGKQKSWKVWDWNEEWHSNIWFNSYLKMLKALGDKTFS